MTDDPAPDRYALRLLRELQRVAPDAVTRTQAREAMGGGVLDEVTERLCELGVAKWVVVRSPNGHQQEGWVHAAEDWTPRAQEELRLSLGGDT